MSRYVTRDPFARTTTYSDFEEKTSCAWCGQRRLQGRKIGALRFRVESDGGRSHADERTFCSRGCREDYYR